MPRAYVSSRGHSGFSFGCLGALFYLFAMVLWWALFAAVIAVVIVALFLALLFAWAAVAVDAILMRTSKGYRAKRANRGPLDWPHRLSVAMANSKSRRRKA